MINIILKVAIIIELICALILLVAIILTSFDRQSINAPTELKLNIKTKTKLKRVKKHRSSDDQSTGGKADNQRSKSSKSKSLSFPGKLTGLSKVKKKAMTTMPKSKQFKTLKKTTAKNRKTRSGKYVKSSTKSKSTSKHTAKESSKITKTKNKQNTRETLMIKTVNLRKKKEPLNSFKGLKKIISKSGRSRKSTKSSSNSDKK